MENEPVVIDDPMLKDLSKRETREFKIASAYDFLFPEVDVYYENLLEDYQFKKDEAATEKIKQSFIAVSKALKAGRFKAEGHKAEVPGGSELDLLLASSTQDFLNKMEALVEGKKMSAELVYFDPDTGKEKKKLVVEFVPEWIRQRFVVGEVMPGDAAHDAEVDFKFVKGRAVPLNPMRRELEEETPSLY